MSRVRYLGFVAIHPFIPTTRFFDVCPRPCGFIPQTDCGERVGACCRMRTGRPGIVGDGDPRDVCVLTAKDTLHGDLILKAIPIGGLRMIDGDEADDKIIAVLQNDALYRGCRDIHDMPAVLRERLRHFFLAYKQVPGAVPRVVRRGPDTRHLMSRSRPLAGPLQRRAVPASEGGGGFVGALEEFQQHLVGLGGGADRFVRQQEFA